MGCGQGFESARFLGAGREVVGVDYSSDAVATAASRYGPDGLRWPRWTHSGLGFGPQLRRRLLVHLIEHFTDPEPHVSELAVSSTTTAWPAC